MMKKRLFIGLALLLCSQWSAADVIVLKDGRRIETQGSWEENGVVKYFFNGTIAEGVPREAVERIETDDAEEEEVEGSPPREARTGMDLEKRLSQKVPPRNPIEEAANATVTIEGVMGSGSGFFVTPAGHILTNSHVIRGDPRQLEAAEKNLEAAEARLQETRQMLAAEQGRIERMEAQIRSNRRRYDNDHNRSVVADARRQHEANQKIYRKRKADHRQRQALHRRLKTQLLLQKNVKILLIDKTELHAAVERYSPRLDLALLKLADCKTPYIRPGSVEDVARSDRLYAIGNPLNFSHSVTAGVFSGRQRGMLMTSAPINAGNSGGPLVTGKGRVVGVNTMKIVGEGVEGIGFAIPIDVALEEFNEFLRPYVTSP